MIEYAVIRNKAQLKEFTDRLNEKRLPFKVAIESIEPVRSLDLNAYLWGIVYGMIADAMGQSIDEVHAAYKKKFRFKHSFEYDKIQDQYVFVLATQSTATAGQYDLWNYVMQVRADAEIELNVSIPMPNEAFGGKLTFEE